MVAAGESESVIARLVLAVPWPLEYRAGIGYLVSAVPTVPGYLLGATWEGARWWYFPVVALVKIPPPALLGLAAGLLAPVAARWRRLPVGFVAVWGLAAALVVGAIVSGRNIGSRYLLPSVALGLVLGAVVAVRLVPATVLRIGGAALVVLQLGMLVASHPHSIAWVNPPADHAYRVVSDSDVDWGQDLRRLALVTERAQAPVYVSLLRGRMAEPVPNTRPLPDAPAGEPPGLIAVSAARLTTYGRDELGWLWAYCPVDVVGASILLYRFTDTVPDRTATATRPAAPCPGAAESHR
jgi:hypothetical protein